MNVVEKIKKSWWIILSFIIYLNGFGFIYIGLKQNNKYWVFEGVMYEIPWLFSIIFINNHIVGDKLFAIALVLLLISIIRSIWVAIKLADVYDNEDKYTVRPTVINNQRKPQENDRISDKLSCCICIFLIFFIFTLLAIL